MISAEDLTKLKTQMAAMGMTPDQAEQLAISKGMLASEAAKLKLKLGNAIVITTNENKTIGEKILLLERIMNQSYWKKTKKLQR